MNDVFIKRNYNIIRQLGEGAFGAVFLVTKKNDDKLIALKRILVKGNRKEPLDEKLRKAEIEIETLRKIAIPECNPNISCYYSHEIIRKKTQAIIYLEMEFINGMTINEYVVPLYEDQDSETLIKIAYITTKGITLALKSIHDKNILHQDIKPENIIVDETKIPKLVDFGLSCITKQKGSKDCIYDKCCKSGGTPEFMAPERLTNPSQVSYPKSDIWSLGATIYYTIFNEHIRDSRMIQNSEINKSETGIEPLDTLINGMTERDLDKRFDVNDILSLLKDI